MLLVATWLAPRPALGTDTSGVVRLFVEKPDQSEAEPEAEVQLKLKTRRIARTRAVVKIEGRYFDREIYLKDAYLDHKLDRRLQLRVGIDKKALGIEYEEPSRDRLTLHRSTVYQYMEELGLVGRQLELRLRATPKTPDSGFFFDIGVGMDGSRDQNVLGSLRYRLGPWTLGTWGLIERHRIERTSLPVWATVTSLWVDTGRFRVATEWFAGVDAAMTELLRRLGDAHTVVFYGPRGEIGVRFPLGQTLAVEPFVQGSLLTRDARQPAAGFQAQGLVGLNLRRSAVALRLNAEWLKQVTPVDTNSNPPLSQPRLYHASLAYTF